MQILSEELHDFTELQKTRQGNKVVFTNGCFDILHVGHVRYLAEARMLGDILVVGLNSDSSVKRLKGNERPIISSPERKEVLLGLKSVDFVFTFSEDTPLDLIKLIKPDFLVKGGDWEKSKIVGSDFVESYGGVTMSIKFHPGNSSTSIIEKIKKL